MKTFFLPLLIFSTLGLTSSCIDQPVYDDVPEIEFSKFNKDHINPATDSLIIEFSFTDGDGDLGTKDNDTLITLFLIDNRTKFPYSFKIPFVDLKGNTSALSGLISVALDEGSVSCRPNRPIQDTISYNLYIFDRAGNKSNIITTPPVILDCP